MTTATDTPTRPGISPACHRHIEVADTHVTALFWTNGEKRELLPHIAAAVQETPGLLVACMNAAMGHHALMWQAALAGDAEATYTASKAWYKAIREAMKQQQEKEG